MLVGRASTKQYAILVVQCCSRLKFLFGRLERSRIFLNLFSLVSHTTVARHKHLHRTNVSEHCGPYVSLVLGLFVRLTRGASIS